MTVELPAGVTAGALAAAKLARIDETHSNPKAKFQAISEPEYPTAAELVELEFQHFLLLQDMALKLLKEKRFVNITVSHIF